MDEVDQHIMRLIEAAQQEKDLTGEISSETRELLEENGIHDIEER
jgi:hypothetical protein